MQTILSIPHLYSDTNWLIVEKAIELPVQATKSGELGLIEWLELHHDLHVYACSEVDREASGLLVFALTPQAQKEARKIQQQGIPQKCYFLISDRKPSRGGKWICRESLDGKTCETSFECLKQGNDYYVYRAEVTHESVEQVRCHANVSGIPILGDRKHGGTNFPRLCLHCGEIRWPGIPDAITTLIPQSFEGLLSGRDRLLVEAAVSHERRLDWLPGMTDAFRCIHRDELQGHPLAIDRFGSWLCVTGFDETLPSRDLQTSVQPVLNDFQKRFGCKGGVLRTNRRAPHRRKLFSDIIHFGKKPPKRFLVREHNLQYEVALNDSQHVGLFLDQRDSRQRIANIAQGKRVANLFAFTCSFSAVTAKAGAEVVFSVDLAAGSLERGKRNFAQNGLTETGRGKFIKEDVQKWLARQVRKKQAHPTAFKTWDIVICDPPVFASSGKKGSFSVEKAWPDLAEHIREILSDDGIALFCNNHRGGDENYYRSELERHFSTVIRQRPPLDFPELPGSPQHVRIYWCEV